MQEYTAEQIQELIKALQSISRMIELGEYEETTDGAVNALTALTAECAALKADKVTIKLRTNEDLLTLDEAVDTINRLRKAYRGLKVKYEPVCPSCGLQNNRFIHNRYCDRCGANMTLPAPPEV